MKESELKIGLCVSANSEVSGARCGVITDIDESIGEKSGLLYEVTGEWFFAEEIKNILPVRDTPVSYYSEIHDIRQLMQNDIYTLVTKYGKCKELKNAPESSSNKVYILKLTRRGKGPAHRGCWVSDRTHNNFVISEVRVEMRDEYNFGDIWLIDEDGVRYSFDTDLPKQEFNVYSYVFNMLETKMNH